MAYYVKASAYAALKLGVTDVRNRLKDGNYMLWQADLLRAPGAPVLSIAAANIGAIVLTPAEARSEFYAETLRPLPEPRLEDWQQPASEQSHANGQPEPSEDEANPETNPEAENADAETDAEPAEGAAL